MFRAFVRPDGKVVVAQILKDHVGRWKAEEFGFPGSGVCGHEDWEGAYNHLRQIETRGFYLRCDGTWARDTTLYRDVNENLTTSFPLGDGDLTITIGRQP